MEEEPVVVGESDAKVKFYVKASTPRDALKSNLAWSKDLGQGQSCPNWPETKFRGASQTISKMGGIAKRKLN
ncbi:hypothetical protein ACHQM5_024349 [Ranunculus cassubicifolius]